MISLVTAASSATGMSEVPAHTTAMVPLPLTGASLGRQVAHLAWRWKRNPRSRVLRASIFSSDRRVMSTLAPPFPYGPGDRRDVRDFLAFAQDDLGKPLPQCPVVVHLGEPKVLEREVLQPLQGLVDRDLAAPDALQQLCQLLFVHLTSSPRP